MLLVSAYFEGPLLDMMDGEGGNKFCFPGFRISDTGYLNVFVLQVENAFRPPTTDP
jgi:hypothetical protein